LKRRIREHRPIIILAVLMVLCLSSLAIGKRGSLVSRVVRNAISVASHPFWLSLDFVEESYDYAAAFVLDYHRHYRETQRLQAEFAEVTQRLAEFKEL
jgi:cell shape-determining protein MreC